MTSILKPLTILLAGALCSTALALPSSIATRAALGGDDSYDWAQLGVSGDTVSDGSAILSNNGLSAAVSQENGALERRDQPGGWSGNFANGDALIWTQNAVGFLQIEFLNPVFGVGAQILRDTYGDFSATIEVFNSLNMSIGTFDMAGMSNTNADNSAIFIGMLDNSASISKVHFTVDQGLEDFAINQLDIVTGPSRVPDASSTLALFGLSMAGIAILRRARRS